VTELAQRTEAGPRWAAVTSFLLCLVGLADSIYLTIEHYSASSSLACPDNGAINCVKVTTSSYSEVLGVPVALLGLLYYVGMSALCLPVVWRRAPAWVGRLRLAGAAAGVAFILYLVWAELFKIDAICLWCTLVHVVTVVLFAVVVLAAALRPIPPD
jgi:uncharacterized membrane protein